MAWERAYLGEDDDLVAVLVQVGDEAVQQRQLAALFPQHLWAGIGDRPIQPTRDQVRVIAVLAHLHQHVVQTADDIGPMQALLDGVGCLLHTNCNL